MKKIISKFLLVFLVLSGIGMSGCNKDKDEAPQLPPESAFVMDFGNFVNDQKSVQSGVNWGTAVLTVGLWNTVLAVTLAVPVATYVEAMEQVPVRVDNNTWKWSFSVHVNLIKYTAELYADVSGSDVIWKMYVSQEGGFTDFLWYEGTSDILRTHGSWTLYLSPASNVRFLQMDWTHNWEANTGDIKYTNVLSNTDGYGDYIHAGITTDTPYNAFYEIFDNSLDKTVTINYNTSTMEGSIFYDGSWHCWDTNLQDITCPE
jgi:hypothetical protein